MLRWLNFIILFFFISSVDAQTLIDSLRKKTTNSIADTVHINLLLQYGNTFDSTAECLKYAHEAKSIAERIGSLKGQANAYKAIGICYYQEANYGEAIFHWNQSMEIFGSMNDLSGQSNMLNNIGVAYNEMGDPVKSLEYCFNALKIARQSGDKKRIATALVSIGAAYEETPLTRDKALTYYLDAIDIFEEIGYTDGVAISYLNIGEIFLFQNDSKNALENFEKAKTSFEELQDHKKVAYVLSDIGKAYQKKGDYRTAISNHKNAYAIAVARNHKRETAIALIGLAESYARLRDYQTAFNYYYEAQKIALEIGSSYELENIYAGLVPAYTAVSDYKNALYYQQQLASLKEKLYNDNNAKILQRFNFEFDLEKKQAQINLLTKDKEIQKAELEKNKLTRNALIVGVVLLFLLAFFFFRNYQIKAKANRMLAEQNQEIREQKEEIEAQRDDIEGQKTEIENLILNILPLEVAQELQKTGTATPRSHESVTVLFTDFKEFTKIAENMSAQELVEELNECFIAFDQIIEEYGLEKIKTIGDAYMCACGIPSPVEDHPFRTVRAALAIQRYIDSINEKRIARGAALWELRIGIHTGSLIAGVVGRKKFAYDIWGNTVNIAARLETAGQVGKVNISETTYELIKEKFECAHRGKIMTKNIGNIDMYFVESENHPSQIESNIEV